MKRSVSVLLFAAMLGMVTNASAITLHRRGDYEPSVYITPRLGFVSFPDEFLPFTGFTEVSDGIVGIDLAFRVVEDLGIGFEIADVPCRVGRDLYAPKGGDVVFLNFDMFYDIPTGKSVYPFVDIGIGRMEINDPYQLDYGYTTFLLGGGVKARIHPHAGLQFSIRHVRPFLEADSLANTQVTGGISFIF